MPKIKKYYLQLVLKYSSWPSPLILISVRNKGDIDFIQLPLITQHFPINLLFTGFHPFGGKILGITESIGYSIMHQAHLVAV